MDKPVKKHILVKDDPVPGLAGLIEAGPFLFTAGCDGHHALGTNAIDPEIASNAEAQCENSYGRIEALLARADAPMSSVARIDHYTSSQDWLPRRDVIRRHIFSFPAALASTGVSAKMSGINMLTSAAIAVADPSDKEILVTGAAYGMESLSSLVRAGPFYFISGIRGTEHPGTGQKVAEETPQAFGEQTRLCYDIIEEILGHGGTDLGSVLRLDGYIRERNQVSEERAIRDAALGPPDYANLTIALPLGMRGEVEITGLALAPGAEREVCVRDPANRALAVRGGGFLFVGECLGAADDQGLLPDLVGRTAAQMENALDVLARRLEASGSALTDTVRLDVYLRDIYLDEAFFALIRKRFGNEPPVVVLTGGEPEGLHEIKLNAIAV